jgi:hypothetical protein
MGNPYQVPKVILTADYLRANVGRSNRALARELGVSPTTIGKYYHAAGIVKTPAYHHPEVMARQRSAIMAIWRRVRTEWTCGAEPPEGER